jgi:hypothetical protein
MSIFKIVAVEHNKTPERAFYQAPDEVLTLIADDGRKVELRLTGDCCSGSYFEQRSVEDVKALVGQTLLGVEPVESNVADYRVEATEENGYNGGSYRYHAVKLSTNQETVVVDWRNESNGYYDGTCTVTGWTPKPKKPSEEEPYDFSFRWADLEEA